MTYPAIVLLYFEGLNDDDCRRVAFAARRHVVRAPFMPWAFLTPWGHSRFANGMG